VGEILGLGMTHYPPLIGHDKDMPNILRTVMKDPGLPERYRDPSGWPEAMRREYGADGGTTSAAWQHPLPVPESPRALRPGCLHDHR